MNREPMLDPVNSGANLLEEIENTEAAAPALWWLGQSGFVIKYASIVFYIDPCLSTPRGLTRILRAPLEGKQVINADMVLCTHAHPTHMDAGSLPAILRASPRCRLVLPKSAAGHAHAIGIPYQRMTTTDSDLRVEYLKEGFDAAVNSIPAAHPDLKWTREGGYPHLGYLLRFDDWTIYHAGDCALYEGIVERLRPYNVSVALLPINGDGNFSATEAAQLAEDIGARWVVPMHYGTFAEHAGDIQRFIDHMLGLRPGLRFKVFRPGEGWSLS